MSVKHFTVVPFPNKALEGDNFFTVVLQYSTVTFQFGARAFRIAAAEKPGREAGSVVIDNQLCHNERERLRSDGGTNGRSEDNTN